MFDVIKEWVLKILKSRLFVLWILMLVMFVVTVQHLFTMQIVKGQDYLNNYTLSIEKQVTLNGTRGNIYDKNGVLLAYNELAYNITLEDSGSYEDSEEKAEILNDEISRLIDLVEGNGDSMANTLALSMDPSTNELSFLVSGTALQGFRRDIYGHSSVSELKVNKKLGYDEAQATEEQIFAYMLDKFGIDTSVYDPYRAYQIAVVRYGLSLNSFQKYISTTVATNVSEETVAVVQEHLYELQGVEVVEDTRRVYNYPEYFSHIIGYTGKISDTEYEELSEKDESYTLNDIVGKSGIEQVMELELQGKKGYENLYVNNVGKVLEVKDSSEPAAGNDIYLSIDSKLQMAVYDLLEQELAGILFSKIINAKEDDTDDHLIPIYDVYNALIENGVIDLNMLSTAADGTYQSTVYQTFRASEASAINSMEAALNSDLAFEDQSDEMKEYLTFVVTYLQDKGVFDKNAVDSSNQTYKDWKKGLVSAKEYLKCAIESSWIQLTALELPEKYADTNEIYDCLVDYVVKELDNNAAFDRIVYKYLIYSDQISGTSLCQILYEQGVLPYDEQSVAELSSGAVSAYSFLKERVRTMELTPAQLALDPCTGSCVLMDPNTGALLACVSYPGYDTNRLANSMDSKYYNKLLTDGSLPLYNNATQQTTAPGSTYKMLIAAAGLTENFITPETEIEDTGVFDKLDYHLNCWIYPGNHSLETVTEALRDSCNYFFCEIGYRFSMLDEETYSESTGLAYITKYAEQFGFGDTTGLEIPESKPNIADEYPVSASIGQSNNDYTTAQLCRYVSAIANEGTVYDLTLLDKETDAYGTVIKTFEPKVKNEITDISGTTWSLIKQGMRMVVEDHKQFDDLTVPLAGKTGTAQESEKRPNHALFVGFAPNDAPTVAVAARIAYGYTSGNACDFVNTVMKYYFAQETEETLLNGQAANVESSANRFMD